MPLKRKDMLEIIRNGGSVSYKGRLISTEERLPSVAELAHTDEDKTTAADDLKKQRELIDKQLAELEGKSDSGKSNDNREAAFKDLNRKGRENLIKIAADMKAEGFPVADLADDATKEVIINAIIDANEAGKGE